MSDCTKNVTLYVAFLVYYPCVDHEIHMSMYLDQSFNMITKFNLYSYLFVS